MKKDFEIKKVLIRKDGVKIVIVPKSFDVESGEYVLIKKLNQKEVK